MLQQCNVVNLRMLATVVCGVKTLVDMHSLRITLVLEFSYFRNLAYILPTY